MRGSKVAVAFGMLCLMWGSSYLFIRLGLRQLSPLSLVAFRLLVGFAVIAVIATIRKQPMRLPPGGRIPILILATINTTVPFLLISWGEVTVPSGLASVLNSTVPIFSVLLAGAVLHDEPITVPKIGGVVVGFLGVALLLSRDLAAGGIQWSHIAGQSAIVLASVCYAVGAVFARRSMRGVPSLTIATYVLAISAAQTVLLTLVLSRPPLLSLTPTTIYSVLWLGIMGSGFAYVLAYYILEHWGAARYTLVAYMLPVTGLALGVIFLDERTDWRILAGSAMVIGGIVLAGMTRIPRRSAPSGAIGRPAAAE